MNNEVYIDQPITVQARFMAGGRVHPTTFIWQERTRYLVGLGRQWVEETDGSPWRCFLAETAAGDTVELRWNTATQEWRLHRAWWRTPVA